MSMTQPQPHLKSDNLQQHLADPVTSLEGSVQEGQALHEVELGLWERLLRLGRECLQQFLDQQGSGDLGPTFTLPTGEEVRRLDELHERRYVTILGEFHLRRTVYGTREGQKHWRRATLLTVGSSRGRAGTW